MPFPHGEYKRRWARWLVASCGVPIEHTALLLDVTPDKAKSLADPMPPPKYVREAEITHWRRCDEKARPLLLSRRWSPSRNNQPRRRRQVATLPIADRPSPRRTAAVIQGQAAPTRTDTQRAWLHEQRCEVSAPTPRGSTRFSDATQAASKSPRATRSAHQASRPQRATSGPAQRPACGGPTATTRSRQGGRRTSGHASPSPLARRRMGTRGNAAELADYQRLIAAARDGRMSGDELLRLAACVHYGEPRSREDTPEASRSSGPARPTCTSAGRSN